MEKRVEHFQPLSLRVTDRSPVSWEEGKKEKERKKKKKRKKERG